MHLRDGTDQDKERLVCIKSAVVLSVLKTGEHVGRRSEGANSASETDDPCATAVDLKNFAEASDAQLLFIKLVHHDGIWLSEILDLSLHNVPRSTNAGVRIEAHHLDRFVRAI